jgi:hypothetical protein
MKKVGIAVRTTLIRVSLPGKRGNLFSILGAYQQFFEAWVAVKILEVF